MRIKWRIMNNNSNRRINQQSLREIRLSNKKRKKRRIIAFVLFEVIALILIFSYTYFLKKYTKIQRHDYKIEEVKNNDISVENIKKMEGYWNIALFGVDSRTSSVGKGSNSDVIMILSINRGSGDIKIASVYRDTYLDTANGKYTKINNAYAVGGPEQAVKALNKNLDLNITDYVTFNWKAVATLVNIMGGVDIEITKPEFKYINSYITETVNSTKIGSVHLKAPGMQHLDGIQAVAYARLRYMDTDYRRTERQREVLRQIFEKAQKSDPVFLAQALDLMLPMVATNLTVQDGIDMISRITKLNLKDTTGFPNDREDSDMGLKGWNIVAKTLETNVRDLHKFLFGTENYKPSNTVRTISETIIYKAQNARYEIKEKASKEVEKESFSKSKNKSESDIETNEFGETIKNIKSTEESVLDFEFTDEELESMYNESINSSSKSNINESGSKKTTLSSEDIISSTSTKESIEGLREEKPITTSAKESIKERTDNILETSKKDITSSTVISPEFEGVIVVPDKPNDDENND